MKLTNRLNLPAPLVAAISNDRYDGATASDYSTTGLLRPPRIVALQRSHSMELMEDASDRIWSLFGQICHTLLERAALDELVEKRLFMTVSGKSISGQIDLYQGDTLTDWKVTTIYKAKDGIPEDWTAQGNINRLLCHENGIEVKKLQNVALYRDFSIMACQRKADYPVTAPVEVFDLPVWPLEQTKEFVEERVALHEAAKVELPLCSEEERWQKPEKWALMKKRQKRAVKLFESEGEALAAAGEAKEFYVEHRPGESTRCLFFCPVSGFCSQFRDMMQEAA